MKQKELLALARNTNTSDLIREASVIRDKGYGSLVTYSPKVFIPLTHLCRDVCHYCTFAKTPKRISSPYMSVEEVVDSAKRAEALGCKEALFTLGERPELRYSTARKALSSMGYTTTLEYLKVASQAVIDNTELLPHLNPGCMSLKEILELRPVSASMGMMLESSSKRFCMIRHFSVLFGFKILNNHFLNMTIFIMAFSYINQRLDSLLPGFTYTN